MDTVPTLQDLKRGNFKVGPCFNLTKGHAARVMVALAVPLDPRAWSFDDAAIKPNPTIYEFACQQLNCTPGKIVIKRDTLDADVEGSRAIVIQTLLLGQNMGMALLTPFTPWRLS